ncbi:MAG: exopolysaccharide biosynthesis polyprenyl glycosylphosphotransferase, partial [Verrucomicrobia bacterium]|nr:exopolysaccharide biosynthesis polyprenyl glycosylphosphotransferase [Verrucomicrobiota bacterium]
VLLVGTVSRLPRIHRWLESKRELGLDPVGFLSDETEGETLADDIPHLGRISDLQRAIQSEQIDQVIILELVRRKDIIQEAVSICEREGVRLLVLSDLEEHFRHSVAFFEDDGFHLIALREEPLENPMNRFLKRALDIVVSLPVVALILPAVTAVVWLFQRWQSPGPVFYVQQRTGLQNRPFEILKFRTMKVHKGPEDRQATKDDDRIYPAGRWFRRLSIDEIPQFVNVLRGDMSVVGPRPHLTGHNAAFSKVMRNYFVRSMVKPGISGLAQVRGYRGEMRTELDIIRRVSSDIDYLENWSFFLDCWIILRTVTQLFFPPKTAY